LPCTGRPTPLPPRAAAAVAGGTSSRPGGLLPRASHGTGLVDHTSGSLGRYLTVQTARFDQRPAWVVG
jgi:hypothetical protein